MRHGLLVFVGLAACGGAPPEPGPVLPPPPARTTDDGPVEPPLPPEAQAVASFMQASTAALHRCWEQAAADDYRLAGEIRLDVEMGEGGLPAVVGVVGDGPGDPVLTRCVVGLVRSHSFAGFGPGDRIELPFQFAAPAAQYTVRAEDSPLYGEEGKLAARVLLDEKSVDAEKASLTLLQAPARARVGLHRHAASAEVVYVLEGKARVLGWGTKAAWDLQAGDAAYAAAGVVHGVEVPEDARLLILGAPGGSAARFKGEPDETTTRLSEKEIRRPPARAPLPRIARASETEAIPIAGGQGSVRILFDAERAGDGAAYVGVLEVAEGLELPEHVHEEEAEIVFVLEGGGDMTIAGTEVPVLPGMAVHVPPGAPHSFKATSPTRVVQFYAPSGPEQRFKAKQ